MTDQTCSECGATVPADAAFCTSCGARLGAAPAAPATADTPQSEEVTRIEDAGLLGATQVLPESPPTGAPPAESAPTSSPASGPSSDAPATFAPPPPAAWSGTQTDDGWGQAPATPPSSWDPPPPAPSSWDQPGAPAVASWPAPAPSTTSADAAATGAAPASGIVGLIGSVLAIVGLFLPWVSARTGTTLSLVSNDSSLTGWAMAVRSQVRIRSDDPYWILGLAIVALIVSLALLVRGVTLLRIALAVLGLGIVGLAVYDVTSIRNVVQDSFSTQEGVDIGIGLFLTLAGGIVCVVAAFLPGRKGSNAS